MPHADRYVVTEIEGILGIGNTSGAARRGVSCMVIDSLVNRRLMATYRSEDYRGSNRIDQARHEARRHAYRLNAAR